MSEPAVKQKNMGRPPQLREINFKLREHARQVHTYFAPHGTEVANMTDPRYWASAAHRCRKNDTIEVFAEDGSYYVEFFIMAVGTHAVQVVEKPNSFVDFTKVEFTLDVPTTAKKKEDYNIEFEGKSKWKCIRKNDKSVMFEGFDSRKAAETELESYLNRLGG